MTEQLKKAKLIPINEDGGESEAIEFMFNPNQLAFSRSIQTSESQGARTDQGIPKVSFAHPNAYSLKISNIPLDSFEKSQEKEGILPQIRKFKQTVEFSKQGEGDKKRPPIYIFTWGKEKYLRCFVKTFSYKLTMFNSEGVPVRATIDLDLQEVDESAQRGNTGSPSPTPSQRRGNSRPARRS